MAQQTINVGTAPNDGTGTPLRTAFQYTNSNFTELYTATGPSGNNINVPGAATITGDLTVRTNQLIANANGVGVGTAPSAWSGIGPALQVEQASLLSESSNQLYLTANGYFAGGQWNYINTASADQYYQIAGSHVWRSAISGTAGTAIGWSTLMTLNSTGLGVGVSPTEKLSVNGGASFSGFGINANPLNPVSTSQRQARFQNTGGDFYFGIESSSAGGFFPGSTAYATCFYNATATPLQFFTNGSLKATIDTSGNVGIGVAPSAWNSSAKAFEIGTAGNSVFSSGATFVEMTNNAYLDSVSNWVRVNTGNAAARFRTSGSGFLWAQAAAGANPITWTTTMQLDSNGNLILQSSATPATLTTNGQLTVNATSNTNLRFSYRGSDGVTRVANITLA